MKKSRVFIIILVLISCIGALSGCKSNLDNKKNVNDKYSVVCTVFPQYDWVKQIVGEQADNYELTLLLDNGVDLHSYQPTAADIAKISECDMFIYVGGESDEWVEDALKSAANKDMIVINLLESLDSVKEEELIEGMEAEEEEEEAEESEEVEYDEHVWLSLKNSRVFCKKITEALCTMDSNNTEIYKSNCNNYVGELDALDKEYKEVVAKANLDTVLFGDRFPFRYLVEDYGLKYYAAFVGCSAETEASFETIAFLAKKVDELDLSVVLTTESSDKTIAQTVINNTSEKKGEILQMDSLQSVTSKKVESGTTYLSVMKENLNVLKQALN